MTRIESEKRTVKHTPEKVYSFITNFENFERLLPQDKVENFQYTEDSCSFRIKGMADLGLKIAEKTEFSNVNMISDGKVPFPFSMTVSIAEQGQDQAEVGILFEGDINPFMKMMVEKPLRNFFNMLVDRLAELDLGQFP